MLRRLLGTVVANPWVYDAVQKMAGREENFRRLKPLLASAKGELLLEAGAGTGEIARILEPTTRYLWLDNDVQKLAGFRTKNKNHLAVLADGTRIPLADHSVHSVLTSFVTHHLQSHELDLFLAELARVCRYQLVFLDGLEDRSSWVSNVMWRYDRGSHPRTEEHLLSKLRQYFELDVIQRYKIYHHYLLCTGRPR
jgi:ubiquinone/menaquinone biosynthesis C-methylase UbiE